MRPGLAEAVDAKLFDFHVNGAERCFLLFARKLVGWHALDLLRRKCRRRLLDHTLELGGQLMELLEPEFRTLLFTHAFALGVISIGCEAKTNHAFVGFFCLKVELRKACEPPDYQRQNARGHRIKRAEMTNRFLLQNAPHPRYDIVRCESARLVNNKNSVNRLIHAE